MDLNDLHRMGEVPADPFASAEPDEEEEVPSSLDDGWPRLDRAALYGLAGEVVETLDPATEADKVAMLVQLLVVFGNVIGRVAHFAVEADKHFLNLFAVLVGMSSKGRKGTSLGQIIRLIEEIAEAWLKDRVMGGLSSGEGLIWAVRDPIEKQEPIREKGGKIVDYQKAIVDPGVDDKRLLVVESEFASTLKMIGRDGNILSATIRQAWDTGRLRVMTKNNPARATGVHISIIGHVTSGELRKYLTETEMGNGFANRFLWLCVRRSKCLPEGGHIPIEKRERLRDRITEALSFAQQVEGLSRDEAARRMWHAVYPELSEGKPGMLGAVTSRAEAQVMRLACLYALLDLSAFVRAEHLEAALALWSYCESSCAHIFGETLGDALADDVGRMLRSSPAGLTRWEIHQRCGKHVAAEAIGRVLEVLARSGRAAATTELTGGRSAERWRSVSAMEKGPSS